jgi:hypothetical protein
MSDILLQYSWNNHKELPQEKFINEFLKISLIDKLKVYRVLSDRRKVLLRKGYNKWKILEDKKVFDVNRKYVLSPLASYINMEEFKTDEEILLTLGILITDATVGDFYDKSSPNHNIEQDSFEKLKEKMIAMYELMHLRGKGYLPHKEDDFYVRLKEIAYIPQSTLSEMITRKKNKWLKCYLYIGIGKGRAERIVGALAKRSKILSNRSDYALLESNKKYLNWLNNIPQNKQYEAIKLFGITNVFANE